MAMKPPTDEWHYADRLSDLIVDATNHTIAQMRKDGGIEPLQLLAGCLASLKALLQTMPPDIRDAYPPSIVHLQEAIEEVGRDLVRVAQLKRER
jgi:hypothetical protein